MNQTKPQNRTACLAGYLLVPHELLHVTGYRLVGKRCRYEWGNPFVIPIGAMARWQDLVGMLFPFLVFFILAMLFGMLAGFASEQAVRDGKFFWFIFWLILTQVTALYVGTAIGDLRNAYLVITNKPWYGWTPFDLFYQPLVDWNDIRKKVESGDVEQS